MLPRDCFDIQMMGEEASGVYKIYPEGIKGGVDVFCDMENDSGGWLVSILLNDQFGLLWKFVFNVSRDIYIYSLDILFPDVRKKSEMKRDKCQCGRTKILMDIRKRLLETFKSTFAFNLFSILVL